MSNLELTLSQSQVTKKLMKHLAANPLFDQRLVFIRGFSGSGKSTLLDSLAGQILEHGGMVEEYGFFYRSPSEVTSTGKHIVATVTPYEMISLQNPVACKSTVQESKGRVSILDLRGMTQDEIGAYVASHPSQPNSSLSIEDVVKYSLGILTQADILMGTPRLTTEMAARISSRYLEQNMLGLYQLKLGQVLKKYLGVQVPHDVLDMFKHGRFNNRMLYDELQDAIVQQIELRRQGKEEASPVFLVPECVEVYDRSFKSEDARIEIFIPRLNDSDFKRLMESFNFKDFHGRFHCDVYNHSPRMRMFKATYRKVDVYAVNHHGNGFTSNPPEFRHSSDLGEEFHYKYSTALEQGLLVVPANPKIGGNSIVIISHDHDRMVDNPINIGWMTETLCQSLGVPYAVRNRMSGDNYTYNPANMKLETIPKSVMDEIRDIRKPF